MKRIAIVITRLDLGGAQKVALHVAKSLDREKFEVHLIAGAGGYLDAEAKKIKELKLVFMKELKHPISLPDDLAAVSKLSAYFKQNKIDIVHTHSSKAGLLGRLAATLAKIRFIAHTVHGFSFHPFQNPLVHFMYVVLERMAAMWCDCLVAVGTDVIEYGLKNKVGREEQYVIIRAGVDVEKFANARPDKKNFLVKYGLDAGKFTVGMIGNLKKQKNPLAFVEIAREVLSVDPDAQFLFAGDGPLRPKVEALLKKYRIADRVKFPGWIEDAHKFVKTIDVFLLTSLWEGLPCTLAEAAAAGKPCVASDIYGNREILLGLDAGFLYDPYDYKEAAKRIILLKNMDRDEVKYSRAAVKFIRDFSVKKMAEDYAELYADN